jgi:hypothetical protein
MFGFTMASASQHSVKIPSSRCIRKEDLYSQIFVPRDLNFRHFLLLAQRNETTTTILNAPHEIPSSGLISTARMDLKSLSLVD